MFKKLFGSSKTKTKNEEVQLPWIDLTAVEQLDTIEENSKTKPQLLFKHSTRCGISRMVINNFKKDYTLNAEQADLYYLDLLNHRDISNLIASRFEVIHESPQLLVIKNGVAVAHASHGAINEMELSTLV